MDIRLASKRHLLIVLITAVALPCGASGNDWDSRFYDPAGGADLVLPMPCGGAMAFQRVETPLDTQDPLADRWIVLGGVDHETGYANYRRSTHIRGAFSDQSTEAPVYYIARYEVTELQRAAIVGECAEPDMRGMLPMLDMSWFDAIDLAQRYTEWLRTEAEGALPRAGDVPGYVRLPTETEWEYAARGGAAVSPPAFESRLFPMDGPLSEYAISAAESRDRPRPVGRFKPNPIGLFDILGNAEELVLEPFRLNSVGREGGQTGGVVTRGGSFRSDQQQLHSAQRQEWPAYDVLTGRAQRQSTFGVRFVISSHIAVSPDLVDEIRQAWLRRLEADPADEGDPLSVLDRLASKETDETRKTAIEGLRGAILNDRQGQKELRLSALQATLVGGGALRTTVLDLDRRIEELRENLAFFSNLLVEDQESLKLATASESVADIEFFENEITANMELVARRKAQLASLEPFLADSLLGLEHLVHSTVETTAGSPELWRLAVENTEQELKAAGQTSLWRRVGAFATLVDRYREDQGMPTADLRRLFLDR